HVDFSCAEHFFERCFPRPGVAIATAVEIERRCAKLRIRVAGEMRFGEEREPADAARMIELMPRDLTEHVEIELAYDAIENCTQAIEICKRRRVASACVDEPFGSERHSLATD